MHSPHSKTALVFGLTVLFLTCLSLFFRWKERFRNDRFQVTFFDVGQGDAALLQFPGGKTMLVDAGGGFGEWDMGKRELFLELTRLGILSLDVALLSHPDQDHGYGFVGILQNITMSEFWLNGSFLTDLRKKPLLSTLLGFSQLQGVKVRGFHKRQSMNWNGVGLTLLPVKEGMSTNNRALVLFAEFGGCGVLFTGDIEAQAEMGLYPPGRVSLLKVAHHGSRTSSTEGFLLRVLPRWAVISVGLRNRYGHPSPDVLLRLRGHAIQTLRTDFHGYVRFVFSKDGLAECQTALGPCGTSWCGGRATP